MKVMNPFFVLKVKVPTRTHPGRYLMLFERKPDSFDNIKQTRDFKVREILQKNKWKNSCVFLSESGDICKICPETWKQRPGIRTIDLARMSPVSIGIEGLLFDGPSWNGWFEKEYIGDQPSNLVDVFKLHCKHEVFLLENGYFDNDIFLKDIIVGNEGVKFVDKDAVITTKDLLSPSEPMYYTYLGRLKKHLHDLPEIESIIESLLAAFQTRDSFAIQTKFLEYSRSV